MGLISIQLNLSTTDILGQKKVIIVERFKQESMLGLSAQKSGHCREVAVVERWPIGNLRTTTTALSTTTGSELQRTAQARLANFVAVVSSTTPKK